ncbi:ECF transporter S component [Bacillus massilinigeriensis]|uniref:ECF transporter S component n=1 Tax=Bacillus mediterraneensis TaxID=1805474 RepID=UPI0008F88963|nr:ECF transporter S component [Bacillus mediterraneensis]
MKKMNVKAFVTIGMLSSISYLLMLLNFPLPPFPNFLMVDFSDIPALIAALVFGPAAGILVELFKNILHYFMMGNQTGVPIGQIANFAAGAAFILPVCFIYNRAKSKRGMTTALAAGVVFMAVLMSVLNYFVFLPAYAFFMNFELPKMLAVTAILPFNLVKGLLISGAFLLLFAKMAPWIGKQSLKNA